MIGKINLDGIIEREIYINENNLNKDGLHIAFAVDDKYIRPAGVCIHSILKNNKNEIFHFHIFTTSINTNDLTKIKELNLEKSSLIIHIFSENIFNELQTTTTISQSMYYRLIIPHVLHNIVDNVIYLDADILCFGNIHHLINIELKENIIAAVPDEHIELDYINKLGINILTPYFNSGMMLINTKAWVSNCILEKFMPLIHKRKYEYPDQDVLNILLCEKIKILPKHYNYIHTENNKLINDPLFVHFVSYPKPWSVLYENNEIYLDYYYSSPWSSYPLDMPISYKKTKVYAKILLKKKKYIKGIFWMLKYLKRKLLTKSS